MASTGQLRHITHFGGSKTVPRKTEMGRNPPREAGSTQSQPKLKSGQKRQSQPKLQFSKRVPVKSEIIPAKLRLQGEKRIVQSQTKMKMTEPEKSEPVRQRIATARERMLERQGTRNSELVGAALREHAPLSAGPLAFAQAAARQLGLTGRGFDRVVRVARTVADLAQSSEIKEAHLAEAVTYRPRELV